LLEVVAQAGSLEELCAGLGRILGLDGPVPAGAVVRALEDPEYAGALMRLRADPPALRRLLAEAGGVDGSGGGTASAPAPSGGNDVAASEAELLGRVTRAFLRWTESGFTPVDAATLDRRLSACRACENYVEPPDRVLYRLARALGESGRVCRLCGCFAARKARMPEEACPAPHTTLEGMSRWEEPLMKSE
jgi:hypothetical protein